MFRGVDENSITFLIIREFPRLCRGGIQSLTIPGVCFGSFVRLPTNCEFALAAFAFGSIGCDQAPLRGQQP